MQGSRDAGEQLTTNSNGRRRREVGGAYHRTQVASRWASARPSLRGNLTTSAGSPLNRDFLDGFVLIGMFINQCGNFYS